MQAQRELQFIHSHLHTESYKMERESITFNTTDNKIIVTLENGTSTEYTSAESYLADWLGREADCVAMGWESQQNETEIE